MDTEDAQGQMAGTANIMLPGAPNQPLPNGAARLGAIEGGALRPGSIDQSQFQQLFEAQRLAVEASAAQPGMTLDDYRKLAGAPRIAAATPPVAAGPVAASPGAGGAAAFPEGIPTLSPEQFAVLTGMAGPNAGSGPDPRPANPGLPTGLGEGESQAAAVDPGGVAAIDSPAIESPGMASDLADGIPVLPPAVVEAEARAESEAEKDPKVVWFNSMPDRDDRRMLEASGKKWRLRETPGARELFLGPDGKFGWDDFVDLINPLQHIPVVAQVYRAVTGDQAYALSQFAGALPFGPISVASAIVDTMVRAQTGRDAGTDMAASILGIDRRTPEEANLHLVTQPASGDLASAPAGSAADHVQVAAHAPRGQAWTRQGAYPTGRDG